MRPAGVAQTTPDPAEREKKTYTEKPAFIPETQLQMSGLDTDKENAGIPPTVPIYNHVELVTSPELSFASIMKGGAGNPLTLFEKKAALINAYVICH